MTNEQAAILLMIVGAGLIVYGFQEILHWWRLRQLEKHHREWYKRLTGEDD